MSLALAGTGETKSREGPIRVSRVHGATLEQARDRRVGTRDERKQAAQTGGHRDGYGNRNSAAERNRAAEKRVDVCGGAAGRDGIGIFHQRRRHERRGSDEERKCPRPATDERKDRPTQRATGDCGAAAGGQQQPDYKQQPKEECDFARREPRAVIDVVVRIVRQDKVAGKIDRGVRDRRRQRRGAGDCQRLQSETPQCEVDR